MSITVPPEYRDKPLIGLHCPWKELEGQLLRINRFIPLVADVDTDPKKDLWAWAWAVTELYSKDQTGYYTPILRRLQFRKKLLALLEVECPSKLAEPSYMPIFHRFDFIKLWAILAVEGNLDPDEEVLVGYPLPWNRLSERVLKRFLPRLDVLVHPKGFLELAQERPRRVEEKGYAHWFRAPRFLRDE